MADYVEKYKCGSCKEYTYEGPNKKGYCSWYRAYYYPDDSCKHWEASDNTAYGSSLCFITSACCEYRNLPDDCYELQLIRTFRDSFIRQQKYGQELIDNYYEIAPDIVEAINSNSEKEAIYNDIWKKINEIIELLNQNKNEEAIIEYMLMVIKLQKIH